MQVLPPPRFLGSAVGTKEQSPCFDADCAFALSANISCWFSGVSSRCQLYVVFQSRDESQPMVTVLTGSESE